MEQYADAVLRRCKELEASTGKKPSLNSLAHEFRVSRPTINTVLDIATGKRPSREERRPENRKFTAPLDEATRREIVRLYHHEELEQKEVGLQCGVHRSTVERVLGYRDTERGEGRSDGRKRRSCKSTPVKNG